MSLMILNLLHTLTSPHLAITLFYTCSDSGIKASPTTQNVTASLSWNIIIRIVPSVILTTIWPSSLRLHFLPEVPLEPNLSIKCNIYALNVFKTFVLTLDYFHKRQEKGSWKLDFAFSVSYSSLLASVLGSPCTFCSSSNCSFTYYIQLPLLDWLHSGRRINSKRDHYNVKVTW